MGRLSRCAKALAKTIAPIAAWRPSAKGTALSTLVAGGLLTSIGTGMIFAPAGVILAGLQLTALALLVINVPRGR